MNKTEKEVLASVSRAKEIDTKTNIYRAADVAAQTVAPLFNLYGWTYGAPDHRPNYEELRTMIFDMIESVRKFGEAKPHRVTCISMGRFSVVILPDSGQDLSCQICLNLARVDHLPPPLTGDRNGDR